MQKTLLNKALVTAALAIALLVPLKMIDGISAERQARNEAVAREVAASYAQAQDIGGPVLVLPYRIEHTEVVTEEVEGAAGADRRVRREYQRRRDGRWIILPSETDWQVHAVTSHKRRGLFRTLVYDLQASASGRLELPAASALPGFREGAQVTWGQPFVSVLISDSRGLSGTPRLVLDGQKLTFENGSGLRASGGGIHAEPAGIEPGAPRDLAFELSLSLRGSQRLGFVPLAGTTRVKLDSPWPHPSFTGAFLPTPRDQKIGPDGFSATWEVSALAASAPSAFSAAASSGSPCQGPCLEGFGVRFVEPVNVYTMVDRALKYSFLFILLGFGAFFLFEVLKGLRMHPAQYLLAGLALALFFLLLLSLSEHIAFASAYALAAAACVGLQGFYLSHVLGSTGRGLGLAGLLAALFAALYGLLINEDASLLLGSLLLFGLLALVMVLTRRLDWYRIGNGEQ